MKALANTSASTLALITAGWIALVFTAWLFTPGGQAVILIVKLAIEEAGGFAAELPLEVMRTWAIVAALVALLPPLVLFATWGVARRSVAKAAA